MTCADHNILFVPCFAADEAQTFDAIFRNDEGAIEGLSPFITLKNMISLPAIYTIAATAEFAKTGKGCIASGCTRNCSSISISSG
jgi:hypothetical protein